MVTPLQVSNELRQVETALAELAGDIVDAAAPAARLAILNHVAAERGSLTLSGMNAVLDIDTTIQEADSSASAKLEAVPQGPWAITNNGTKPHQEIRVGARGVSRAMKTPYGFKSRVNHPGTSGSHVWESATAAADVVIDQAARSVVDKLPRH